MDVRDLLTPCSNIYLVGSQMYGLATPESDEDFLQIYFDSTDYVRPFPLYPEEVQLDQNNYKVYSLAKFAKLIVKGNPNIVEVVLETPFQENCDTVTHFMEMVRPIAVHRGLASAFMGHLNGLIVEMERKGMTPKRISQGVRVVNSLSHLLHTGTLLPYRDQEGRGYALVIKQGEVSIEAAFDYLKSEMTALEIGYAAGVDGLPDNTQLRADINSFFKEIYHEV